MVEFQLLRPLWLIAIMPLAYLVWRLWRSQPKQQDWTDICDQHLLPQQLSSNNPKPTSAILSLAFVWLVAVVALAGPSWNERPLTATAAGEGRVILLDLSAAMTLANTNNGPSRLNLVHDKLAKILDDKASPPTALIVFAQYPYLIAPLTTDLNTLGAVIAELTPEIMPQVMPQVTKEQGFRLDRALSLAQQQLAKNIVTNGEVLVLTTGDDSAEHALANAQELVEHQYRLSVLSLQHNSQLEQLALLGGGHFVALTRDEQDIKLLQAHSGTAHNRNGAGIIVREDNGTWLLILLLPVVALGFRRGRCGAITLPLVFISSLLTLPTHSVWAGQSTPDSQFVALHAQDAYLAGNYVRAEQLWRQLNNVEAHYNRANTLVRLGRYKNALVVYQQVMIKDPEHQDARINHDLVTKFLEQPDPDDSDNEDNDQQNDDGNDSGNQGKGKNNSSKNNTSKNNTDNTNSSQQSAGSNKNQSTSVNLSNGQSKQQQLVRWLDKVPEPSGSFLQQKLLRQHQRRGYPDIKGDQ